MREINKIIVHCSDSDNLAHDDIEVIRKWHLERGFDDVGYHFFINKKGMIQEGRPIEQIGAHCEGHNHDSIGICLAGKTSFNLYQFSKLKSLCKDLCFDFNITRSDVYGHREFNKLKTCPNFDVQEKME